MKQEEDNKIATMGPMEYLRSNELEQVVEEEEEFGDDELMMMENQGKEQGSHIGGAVSGERASGQLRSISASSVSSVSSAGSVRTAKAEKRLKDRLSQEVY
jgi:hypothetical protein